MFNQRSEVSDLAIRHKMLITESLALKPNITAIRTKLGGVARIFGEWVSEKVVPQPNMGLVIYANTLRNVEKARYSDVSTTLISIPRGTRVNMPQYVAELIPMVEFCESLERDVLKPFSIWVALRKAAPDSLKSATNIRDLKGLKVIDINPYRAKVDELLDPTSRIDKLPMSKMYPNLSSLQDTWAASNSLITRYLATKPRSIVQLVQDISKDIVQIVDEIEKSGEADTVAPNTVATLSTICYQMASCVEFYGVVGVLLKELSVVCNNNNYELKKVIAASASGKMVTESLVPASDGGFELYGKYFTERDIRQMFEERFDDRTPIPLEDLVWIFNELPAGAHIEENQQYDFSKDAVAVVEVDGTLYPILNLGFLRAAQAAGYPTVPTVFLDPRHT